VLTLYHYTSLENALAILREGFRDGEGTYLTRQWHRGVWLADRPLDCNDTGQVYAAEAWIQVSLDLSEDAIAAYEWVEETGDDPPFSKGYREWLLPAVLINAHARLELYDSWDEDAEMRDAGLI
jgi:hypothetical protein